MNEDLDDFTDEEIAAIEMMQKACPPVEMIGKAEAVQAPSKEQMRKIFGSAIDDAVERAIDRRTAEVVSLMAGGFMAKLREPKEN